VLQVLEFGQHAKSETVEVIVITHGFTLSNTLSLRAVLAAEVTVKQAVAVLAESFMEQLQ
jgi:hypothetical protein